jgi:hypothetical protein
MRTLIQAGLLAGLLLGIACAQNNPHEWKLSEQPRIQRYFSTEALDRAIPGLTQWKNGPGAKKAMIATFSFPDTSPVKTTCAARLVEVPIQQDTDFIIGNIRPAGNIDPKSLAKLPAPPCAKSR